MGGLCWASRPLPIALTGPTRLKKGPLLDSLEGELRAVVTLLAQDKPLPARYRDHVLTGDWRGHRDCHIRPDLVLIYQLIGRERLILVRLGSHARLRL